MANENGSLGDDPTTLTRAQLEAHALALRTVLAISDAVHLSRDFEDLAERAVEAIATYTHYASVALFRVDDQDRSARLVASRGFTAETLARSKRLPLDGSLTGIAVARGEVVTSDHIGSDARVTADVKVALVADAFTGVASVPLLFRGRALGALNLIYKDAGGLEAREQETLLAIGRTIGMAMANRLAAEEQRNLEAQMWRNEQLSGLGVLAGGIAHDFNNLLAGFLINVSLAAGVVRELGAPARAATEWLEEAERMVLRARGLVRQLLTFAQGGAPVKAPTDQVGEIVRDAANFAVSGASVRCEVKVGGDLGRVEVDAGQVAQVVHNLVLNAAQASAEGGAVVVDVGIEEVRDVGAVLTAGRWLRIRVSDAGRGIPPDVLPRIFEPYFTTRKEGTGLGLATTHSIVKRHGGHIDVASSSAGTTFTVYLPAATGAARAEAPPQEEPVAARPGSGRVLVVDDEPAILRAVGRILEQLGYEPEVAVEGEAAIALYRTAMREGRPFRAVLLDLTIPGGLGGGETMARLRAIDPTVRAIVASGYSADTRVSDYREHGFVAALEKPYTVASLASALRVACEGGR